MGTVNVNLGEASKLNLILGQQLENAVTEVVFDFSAWQTAHGSGTLGLSVQRPGEDQPYAVTLTVSGTNATWSITDLDTAYKGVGEIQLTYTVGTVVKKSVVYKFTVYRSLGENGEYPSPGQTWQEEIEDEIADVKQDLFNYKSWVNLQQKWFDNNLLPSLESSTTSKGLTRTPKERNVMTLNGSPETGANGLLWTSVTLTSGTKYSFLITGDTKGVAFGFAGSGGFVVDSGNNRFQTSVANKVMTFVPANTYTNIYMYFDRLNTTPTFNNEDLQFFLVEGDYSEIYNYAPYDNPYVPEEQIKENIPTAIVESNLYPSTPVQETKNNVVIKRNEYGKVSLSGNFTSDYTNIGYILSDLDDSKKYTLVVKNSDDLPVRIGLGRSGGFVTDSNGNRVYATFNSAVVFQPQSDFTGGYVFLNGTTPQSLDNVIYVYLVEGEHDISEFEFYQSASHKDAYATSRLHGKKVAWYGDSITQGYEWCGIVNGLFEFNGTNCGSGGSRISYTPSRNDSMCLTSRMQGNYTPTSGVATAIPSDTDVIFVEGGTNDWGNSVTVGDSVWDGSPNNEVYAEACHLMFDNLTTLFPNAEIIVLGSPWAKWANQFIDTYGILNNIGLQTVDYGDILLDVAGRWGFKGINISRLLGFNDNNISSYTSDGIHPNSSGSKKIADVVAKYLLTV